MTAASTNRTINAVVTDLFHSGLSVEQQILVNELVAVVVGIQAKLDAETSRKAKNAERMRNRRAAQCSTVQHSPTPPRDKLFIKKSPQSPPLETDFDEWYKVYPRHEAPRAALKAYRHARKRGATKDQLLEGARRYVREVAGREKQFVKTPAAWLNADCWLDEGVKVVPFRSPPKKTWAEIQAEKQST